MRDRGIPTWRDIDNLESEPTEDAIREVLEDDNTSGAILWVTPDVVDSEIIRRTEARLIAERFRRKDGFWVVAVAAGGLNYSEIAKVFERAVGNEDLSLWNFKKLIHDPASMDEINSIAKSSLHSRAQAVAELLSQGDAFELVLHARGSPIFGPQTCFSLDWTSYFASLPTETAIWNDLRLAVNDVAFALKKYGQDGTIRLSGTPSIPAAVLLGSAFPTRDGPPPTWLQRQPTGQKVFPWSLSESEDSVLAQKGGWETYASSRKPAGTALAVLVNITDKTETAFANSQPNLPDWRGTLTIRRKAGPDVKIKPLTSQEAASLVWLTVESIRDERHKYGNIDSVHLFIAGPAGFAVLLGSALATLPPITTYEYDTASSQYVRAATILT